MTFSLRPGHVPDELPVVLERPLALSNDRSSALRRPAASASKRLLAELYGLEGLLACLELHTAIELHRLARRAPM